jgi:hypothetical protein
LDLKAAKDSPGFVGVSVFNGTCTFQSFIQLNSDMRFLATTNMFMANQASILRLVDYNNNTVLSLDQNGLSIPSYQPSDIINKQNRRFIN